MTPEQASTTTEHPATDRQSPGGVGPKLVLIFGEPATGGVARLSILLANQLAGDYDVTVLATTDDMPYELDPRIDVVVGGGLMYAFGPGHAMKNLLLFPVTAQRIEADAVVNLSGSYPSSVALDRLGCNVVHYTHHVFDVAEMFPDAGLVKRAYGGVLEFVQDRAVGTQIPVLSNSARTKQAFEERYRASVYRSYPPIDVDTFTSVADRDDYVLISGRYHPDKKIGAAIDRLDDHDVVVAGSVADEAYFEQLRDEYPAVDFRQNVPESDWIDLHQRAGAYVFTNPEEDFGITPGEAMSCGVPVVIPEGAGIGELIEDGVNGFLAESDLSDLDEQCAAAKDAGEDLRSAARATVVEHCSPKAIATDVAMAIEIARTGDGDDVAERVRTVGARRGVSEAVAREYFEKFGYTTG